ncbi:hypothetical protein F4781DRAFT_162983 [Annulohypoxylon bovei var. microspora]|nr:hypothetical protein F4781DRAFT_162983 [Annulohypoxylon bovei var. microspora]
MAGERFKRPSSDLDLGSRVRHDPFGKLPYAIVCNICHQLPAEGLIDMARASWAVHSLIRNKNCFWKNALKYNMPWFFEVQELMQLGALRRPEMYKGIYLWAERKIWPRRHISGPLMYIANRRRIWVTCETLVESYLGCLEERMIEYWEEEDEEEEEDEDEDEEEDEE